MEERILIIDDDARLRELLSDYLSGYGFEIHCLPDGLDALDTVREKRPELIILDLMMPGADGLEVLRILRQEFDTAVIMLTAKGEETDRIVGLEMGADDYLPKPFNPRELLARIRAVLRRRGNQASDGEEDPSGRDMIKAGGLSLDLGRQCLWVGQCEVELSATEYRLLKALMERPGKVLDRDQLMNLVWDRDFSGFDRSIDVHVSKIRAKLEPHPGHEKRIKTVWGAGYMFVEK